MWSLLFLLIHYYQPTFQTKWNGQLDKAVKYYEKHGVWPPKSEETCGMWVHNQRTLGKKFMKDPKSTGWITQDRIDKLTEAGFDWNPRANNRKKEVSSLIFVRLL